MSIRSSGSSGGAPELATYHVDVFLCFCLLCVHCMSVSRVTVLFVFIFVLRGGSRLTLCSRQHKREWRSLTNRPTRKLRGIYQTPQGEPKGKAKPERAKGKGQPIFHAEAVEAALVGARSQRLPQTPTPPAEPRSTALLGLSFVLLLLLLISLYLSISLSLYIYIYIYIA